MNPLYSFTVNHRHYVSTNFDRLLAFSYWMGTVGVWERLGVTSEEINDVQYQEMQML